MLDSTLTMLSSYPHHIYDLDETITTLHIDWDLLHVKLSALIHHYDPEVLLPSELSPELLNLYLRQYGPPFRTELRTLTEAVESKTLAGHTPNPAVIELLKTQSPHVTRYLLTSNCRVVATQVLTELKLHSAFDQILTLDDVEYFKPDPSAFHLLTQDVVPQSEFLMIGDSLADEGFALNAGIAFMHVTDLR